MVRQRPPGAVGRIHRRCPRHAEHGPDRACCVALAHQLYLRPFLKQHVCLTRMRLLFVRVQGMRLNLLRVMVEMPPGAGSGAAAGAPVPMRRGRTPLQRLLQRMSLMHTHSEYEARLHMHSIHLARWLTAASVLYPCSARARCRYVDHIEQLLVRWASLRALWWFRAKLKPVRAHTRGGEVVRLGCFADHLALTAGRRLQAFASALRGEFDINPQFAVNALGVFQHATQNGHVLAGAEVSCTRACLPTQRSELTASARRVASSTASSARRPYRRRASGSGCS